MLVDERPGNLLPAIVDRAMPERVASVKRELCELQQRFAQRSRRGTWRVVPDSDHLIAATQPHAVARAVMDVITEWRASARPPR